MPADSSVLFQAAKMVGSKLARATPAQAFVQTCWFILAARVSSVFFLSCNGSTGFSVVRQNLFIHAGRLLVWLCATPAQSFWLWCF